MSLVTLEELQGRLDWELDAGEKKVAQGALDDATALVLYYGSSAWTETSAPPVAKMIVKAAATRYLRNPDGYDQSRAGDETVGWGDAAQRPEVYLTPGEIDILKGSTGGGGLWSARAEAWPGIGEGSGYGVGYVPMADGKPFPYYADDPW